MNATRNLAARSILLLAFLCGSVSIVLFVMAPTGAWRVIHPRWPLGGVLCWDALLSLAFFVQHSGMVRRGFRARMARHIPPRYHAALYAISSGVALAAVAVLWLPSGRDVLVLGGLPRQIAAVGSVLAVAVFVWGGGALKGFDPFGLTPIRDYLSGRTTQPPEFIVRGPYRWVRHPLYFSVLALFWLCPDLTLDRLLLNVLWTAWIYVGTRLEEADLTAEFGGVYREYRQTVPMLVPWPIAGRFRLH